MRFHKSPQISGVWGQRAFADEMLPLKKPFLDPSWLLLHRLSWISKVDFGAWVPKNGKALAVALKETFTRSQLASISSIFIDFRRFHKILAISMDFRGPMSKGLCGRDAAPKETFARSQLAAISSIFMDFRGVHKIP